MPITILLPVFLAAAVVAPGPATSGQIDTSPSAVVGAATAHLETYKAALAFVLADEQAVQEVFNNGNRRVARRETTGDFFLTYVEVEGRWLSVRDINAVDGEPVPNREELSALLRQGSIGRIGRAVADRNARYNIGSITRNFNDPMFALLVLDPKHQGRFRFSRTRVETSAGVTLVTLSFTERDAPTLVHGADGRPIYTRGLLVIDAATGRLHRSEVTLRNGPTTARLTTTFAHDERLDLWLPDLMEERYDHSASQRREVVTVESRYRNYRRFETLARIK